MDAVALYQLMSDPSVLNADTLPELRSIVEKYPSFQVARMLYLKNMFLLSDIGFEAELRKMSIFISDRKRLYRFIECDENIISSIFTNANEADKDSFSLIDAFLSNNKDSSSDANSDNSLLFQPSISSDYLFWSLSSDKENKESDPCNSKQLHGQDLIDSFIESEQQRTPGSGLANQNEPSEMAMPESFRELDDENSHQSIEDSCLTETLARIYIKQKRYEKALQIIKNLSLKYPEKNVYFADQIRFLEKLIINTKK